MNNNLDIIFADDDLVIRKIIAKLLTDNGYRVRVAKDGAEAFALYEKHRPDLMLLDIGMPKMTGTEVCARIRENDPSTPILFFTGFDSETEEVNALGLGADSFISKNVSDEVILARLNSITRRLAGAMVSSIFDFAGATVDPSKMQVESDGQTFTITEKELAILRFFADNPNEVFNRDHLLTRFWGIDSENTDNVLSVVIFRLRERLGKAGKALETVRGIGYAFRP